MRQTGRRRRALAAGLVLVLPAVLFLGTARAEDVCVSPDLPCFYVCDDLGNPCIAMECWMDPDPPPPVPCTCVEPVCHSATTRYKAEGPHNPLATP